MPSPKIQMENKQMKMAKSKNPNGKGGIITYLFFACQTDHKNTIAVWTARTNIFAARFRLWSLPTVPDLLEILKYSGK